MTSRSDVERVLDRYLAEGGEQVPDRVVDAALDQIDHIPQRRALRVPWRFTVMPTFLKPALAGVAVIAALVVGGMFLSRGPTDTAGGRPVDTPLPSASASASAPAAASPSPSASVAPIDTSDWKPFTSDLYGYEIAHPPLWSAVPASREWSLEDDRADWVGFGVADRFRGIPEGGLDTLVTAFADDVPSGTSADEWIEAYYEPVEGAEPPPPGCEPSSQEVKPTSVDGHSGTLVTNDSCGDAQAFVLLEGRMHVFAIWRDRQVPLLEAFLSTVEFQQ